MPNEAERNPNAEKQARHREGNRTLLMEIRQRVAALEGLVEQIATSVGSDRPDAPDHAPAQKQGGHDARPA